MFTVLSDDIDPQARAVPNHALWHKVLSALVTIWFYLLWPFFGLAYLLRCLAQDKTFYFHEARDAVLAGRTRGTTWQLSEHMPSTIGAGQGR